MERSAHEEGRDARTGPRRGATVGEAPELLVPDDEDANERRETRGPEDPRDRGRHRGRHERRDRFTELATPEPHDDEHDGVDLEGRGESDEEAAGATSHDEGIEHDEEQEDRGRLAPDETLDLEGQHDDGGEREATTEREVRRPVSRREVIETDRDRRREAENAQPRPQEGYRRRRQPDERPEQEYRARRIGEGLHAERFVDVARPSQCLEIG